jgi:hypothetical protein
MVQPSQTMGYLLSVIGAGIFRQDNEYMKKDPGVGSTIQL